jgi:hypothetical protein
MVVSELNSFRVRLAREFGLDAINPLEVDLEKKAMDETSRRERIWRLKFQALKPERIG